MAARRPNAPNDIDRPFNNLLRRLSASDFGLIAPHLAREVAKANDLLYTLMARVTDQFTNEGIGKLIEQMKAQKAALHLQQETLISRPKGREAEFLRGRYWPRSYL